MKHLSLMFLAVTTAATNLVAITIFSNDFNVADTTDASFLNHFKAPGYPTDGRPTDQFFTLYNSSNSYNSTTMDPATAINYTAGTGTGFSHSIVNNALVMSRITSSPRAGAKILEFGDVIGAGTPMPQDQLFVFEGNLNFTYSGVTDITGTSRNNGIVLFIGNNFGFTHGQAAYTDVDDGNPPVGDAFASISLVYDVGNGFAIAPTTVAASTTYNFANPTTYYTSAVDIFWVMNNTGSAGTYTDPNGGTATIANDTWDVWVEGSLVQDDIAALIGANLDINSFQLFFAPSGTSGASLIWDSMSIYTVPEPRVYVLAGGLLALGVVLYRRRRA